MRDRRKHQEAEELSSYLKYDYLNKRNCTINDSTTYLFSYQTFIN